jgi:hypothetical protein
MGALHENDANGIRLNALLLADQIYQDKDSGKYVVAGIFHQINVPGFPATLEKSVGLFVSLTGVSNDANVELTFVDPADGTVLMRNRSLRLTWDDADTPVQFALEIPPLPLPHPGQYRLQLAVNGTELGASLLSVLDLQGEP